ncbi:MAG TPA: HAMP domain-containing sensor histidine kinase [Gaiellaceae bacterium]
MRVWRTVGARLSLALLVVIALALGLVWLVVVPSLQSRLVNAKLTRLEREAPKLARIYPTFAVKQDFAGEASAETNARVVVFSPLSSVNPETLTTIADSRQSAQESAALSSDSVALSSALTGSPAHGTVTRLGQQYAEVAVPGGFADTILFAVPIHDALQDVDLVERRLLLAGGIALLAALAIGYGAARFFARRIRRLERAAERIASGRFDEPVAERSSDELGELSRAFDRMRIRLSGLEHARREFVANASHELRTPLFSLGGFIELLEDEELDEPTRREFLETMAEQVRRLAKLAEDLLDLSRLDAGHLHVKSGELDLAQVAADAVEEFAGVAKASEHPLELLANGAAETRGDEQRVLQIVRILIENALVHTPRGTPVRVSAQRLNGEASVVVEDYGPGIVEEDREQLFERFYRGEGTKASGSGLGLAIARELAALMGGEIALESRPGRTVFTFVLPSAKQAKEGAPGP